ncbi:2-(3-amino-3-carboxypropyl)histidine synthase subunit 2 [Cercospora zeina]
MIMPDTGPVLATPAEHIFEAPTPAVVQSSADRLSEEQLYVQYEIRRTIDEIRAGQWSRIALQFPDDMLLDAPRVFERLRDGLRQARSDHVQAVSEKREGASLHTQVQTTTAHDVEEKLCILGDTSYGACCVDEVAAEHMDAEVVVHYGRSCLSPTARLPVIYVFTAKALDIDAVVASFTQTYQARNEKVCLMADIPYSHHLEHLSTRLTEEGYTDLFKTEVVHNPASLIPNRSTPESVTESPDTLQECSIFHISEPPTSLLLILSSRIRSMHIFPTDPHIASTITIEASTSQLLRRRYALITRLASVPIFGILINTLSVSNYLVALQHCQDLIRKAGKKSYVFVVGKVNAAKVANFSEIGGWVVIGCWESSLIESKDFYRPIITPFELEVALQSDAARQWGGEWIGDFSQLLGKQQKVAENGDAVNDRQDPDQEASGDWAGQPSDDEPPEFDLRTGQYVSHSRPMGRPRALVSETTSNNTEGMVAPPSSALVQRAKGDVAAINGQVSPAAEFLRSQRTWTGLGSDHEIAYERDADGKIIGAAMEEGRSGVAKGYTVGDDITKG